MSKPDQVIHTRAQSLSNSVSHQLAVTARRVAKLFTAQYAMTCKLTPAEWRVMAALAENGNAIPTAVSDFTGMDKVSVSRAVAGLMNRELVKQVGSQKDGRMRMLSLTRKGVAAHSAAARLTLDLEASLVASLSNTDFAALKKGLDRLRHRAEELSDPGANGAL